MKLATGVVAALVASQVAGCAQINAFGKARTFASVESALLDADVTDAVDMPESGQANYEGVALIGVQEGVQVMGLAGDALLTATFAPAGGTITGRIDDFVGANIDPADLIEDVTGNLASMKEADGVVRITNGVIAGNTFTADFDGDIDYDDGDTDVSVDGTMDGAFYGTQAQLIDADASISDGNMTATLDGDDASTGWLELIAERD